MLYILFTDLVLFQNMKPKSECTNAKISQEIVKTYKDEVTWLVFDHVSSCDIFDTTLGRPVSTVVQHVISCAKPVKRVP